MSDPLLIIQFMHNVLLFAIHMKMAPYNWAPTDFISLILKASSVMPHIMKYLTMYTYVRRYSYVHV